jgi:hypothetical protein
MKKFIALFAIATSGHVFASTDLEFGDLNYILKQGQVNVLANAIHSSYQVKQDSTKLETEGYTFQTAYGYGIMDNLNLYLGLDYNWDMKTANETTNDSKWSQDGLKNPTLTLNYRLLNQQEAAVNVDFGFTGAFALQDQEIGAASGASTKDGNASDGRSAFTLSGAVGRKWNEANEWRLSAGLVHRADGERDDLVVGGDKENVDVDSSQDFFVRAAYQYRPVQEFMMVLSLTGTRIGEVDEKSDGVKTNYEDHNVYDFGFDVKYLVTDTFIVKYISSYGNNPDYDVKTGGTKTEFKNIRQSLYALGVDFLF